MKLVVIHGAPGVGKPGKITSVESLRGALGRWNFNAPIPFRDTLQIDNSALEADVVARRIATHFSLPRGPRSGV